MCVWYLASYEEDGDQLVHDPRVTGGPVHANVHHLVVRVRVMVVRVMVVRVVVRVVMVVRVRVRVVVMREGTSITESVYWEWNGER